MTMLRDAKLIAALAVLALASGCASAPATHATAADKSGAAPVMDEDAMMAQMQKLAALGPEHRQLAEGVGHWENTYRMRWSPDMPWQESKGTTDISLVLGGRYTMERHNFEVMGQKMEGLGFNGFDNHSGEYTSTWADTGSTWWTTSRGKAGPDGSIDYKGMMTDVAGTRPFRMLVKAAGDTFRIEMYDTIPPGGEVLVMTIDSKRTGPAR